MACWLVFGTAIPIRLRPESWEPNLVVDSASKRRFKLRKNDQDKHCYDDRTAMKEGKESDNWVELKGSKVCWKSSKSVEKRSLVKWKVWSEVKNLKWSEKSKVKWKDI